MPELPANATFMVTGGAGFIGSHLVRALVGQGARRVIVLDSLRYGDPANLGAAPDRVELVKHQLGFDSTAELAHAMTGVTHLFHLAAEKHNQSKDDPAAVYRANLVGMHALLDAACAAGVRKVVFGSSLYAHGRYAGAPLAEDDLPAPRTVYGITKLAGEHLLRHFADRLPWVALRYFFIYGPRQFAGMGYRSVIVKNFERLLAGDDVIVRGDGTQELDYVYVDDAVAATVAALTLPVHGELINVASGTGTPIATLLDHMVEVSGRAAGKTYEPADWTAGTRRIGTTERAASLLGWRATTSLAEGLSRTLAWMKNPTS